MQRSSFEFPDVIADKLGGDRKPRISDIDSIQDYAVVRRIGTQPSGFQFQWWDVRKSDAG